jgi:hypothetical protein
MNVHYLRIEAAWNKWCYNNLLVFIFFLDLPRVNHNIFKYPTMQEMVDMVRAYNENSKGDRNPDWWNIEYHFGQ